MREYIKIETVNVFSLFAIKRNYMGLVRSIFRGDVLKTKSIYRGGYFVSSGAAFQAVVKVRYIRIQKVFRSSKTN